MRMKRFILLGLIFISMFENIPAQEITLGKEIDLGLSVNWASWNVGASSPEQYGDYYAWGETTTKDYVYMTYTYFTYKYYNEQTGYIDIGSNISGTKYDVARQKWGDSWRMPTSDECKELISKCTWAWTTYNGVKGYKVTGPNGNTIFLPAAGYYENFFLDGDGCYWCATLHGLALPWAMFFEDSSDEINIYSQNVYLGCPIRPVKSKTQSSSSTSSSYDKRKKQENNIDYNKMSIKELQDKIKELRKDGVTQAERNEIIKITEIISKRIDEEKN